MAYLWLVVIFSYLIKSVQAENKCLPPIKDEHLKYLDEMIDAQLNTSCSLTLKLIDNQQMDDYCYRLGVINQLSVLFEKLEFKPNSQSYNRTRILYDLYNQRMEDCLKEQDDMEEISRCSRNINLSPAQILERVKMSFVIFRDFEVNSEVDCYKKYHLCKEDDNLTKGPLCACSSPTIPSLSGTDTQKSLINLSKNKSSAYASIIPSDTAPLTEHMSGTNSQNPRQSSESIEMSSFIITSIPTEVQPLTTIMDHLHTTTTDRLVSGPESSHTKMDISFSSMEFTNDTTESTYNMSLSQTRTHPDYFNIESLNTDGSHTETLSTTRVLKKDFSQVTTELTSVTEPGVKELLETTELNIVSRNSVSGFPKYSESTIEANIESSSSTITKMRRSIENVDKTLNIYISTHAQSVLSSDDSATEPPHLASSIPHKFKSLQNLPQESKIRNLGWAASYLSPAMLTNKPISSEAEMSSSVSPVQLLTSEASLHPNLTAHEGGYTYNNNQHQERNVAGERDNRINGFNLLPIIETEQHQDGRQNNVFASHQFLVMIPSTLAIIFFCGFLYFMYRYRLLRLQQNQEQARDVAELRPLAV